MAQKQLKEGPRHIPPYSPVQRAEHPVPDLLTGGLHVKITELNLNCRLTIRLLAILINNNPYIAAQLNICTP